MNNIVVYGRLVDLPSISATQDGVRVAKFRLADGYYEKGVSQANFYDVSAFGENQVKAIELNLRKGSKVIVIGNLRIHNYKGEDGTWRMKPQISANNVIVIDYLNADLPKDPTLSEIGIKPKEVEQAKPRVNKSNTDSEEDITFGNISEEDLPF